MNNIKPTTRRLGMIPFLLIWLAGHALAWGGLYYLWELYGFSDFMMLLLSGLILGGGIGLVQKLLLRYTYGLPLNGWLRLTILGWMGGWLSYYIGAEWIPGFFSYPLGLTIIPMFAMPALLQWFLLRRHVKSAWLWVMSAAVSALTFGFAYDSGSYNLNIHLLSASVQGVVTGLTLLWLFGMTGALEQPQRQRNVARLSQEYYDYEYEMEGDEQYHEDDDYHSSHFIQG